MELDCNLIVFRSSQMQTKLETGHEKIQDLEEPKGMSDDIVDSARLEDEAQQLRKGFSSVEKEGKTELEQANQSIPFRIVAAKEGLVFGRRRPTVYNPQTKQPKP